MPEKGLKFLLQWRIQGGIRVFEHPPFRVQFIHCLIIRLTVSWLKRGTSTGSIAPAQRGYIQAALTAER